MSLLNIPFSPSGAIRFNSHGFSEQRSPNNSHFTVASHASTTPEAAATAANAEDNITNNLTSTTTTTIVRRFYGGYAMYYATTYIQDILANQIATPKAVNNSSGKDVDKPTALFMNRSIPSAPPAASSIFKNLVKSVRNVFHLSTWKKRYFRLRDKGILCYKSKDHSRPLFEIQFTSQTTLHDLSCTKQDPASQTHNENSTAHGNGSSYIKSSVTLLHKGAHGFQLVHVRLENFSKHPTPQSLQALSEPLIFEVELEQEKREWVHAIQEKLAMISTVKQQSSFLSSPRSQAIQEKNILAPVYPNNSLNSLFSPDYMERALEDNLLPDGVNANNPSTTKYTSTAADKEKDVAFHPPSSSPNRSTMHHEFHAKYSLLDEIGEGSFSVVRRAINNQTGALYAVKCTRPSKALQEEVAILKRLNHPSCLSLYDFYDCDDICYVVTDYMRNGDLCDLLMAQQRLDESTAQVIVAKLARGIHYIHQCNIVHRDIKPENVLLDGVGPDAAVKIADFGLARQLPSRRSTLTMACGTPEYAAPELLLQFQEEEEEGGGGGGPGSPRPAGTEGGGGGGRRRRRRAAGGGYGQKSDVFSLGMVTYILLVGTFPFSVESADRLRELKVFSKADLEGEDKDEVEDEDEDDVDENCNNSNNSNNGSKSKKRNDSCNLEPSHEKKPKEIKKDLRDMSCLAPDAPQWTTNDGFTVSDLAKDVIFRMLAVDPAERLSSDELLEHPWIKRGLENEDESVLYEREKRRKRHVALDGFKRKITKGIFATKYGRKGKPHGTVIRLEGGNQIVWRSRQQNYIQSALQPLSTMSQNPFIEKPLFQSSDIKTENSLLRNQSHDLENGNKTSSPPTVAVKSILLSDITDIVDGHQTKVFLQQRGEASNASVVCAHADLCCSIVATFRTLDLAFDSKQDKEWFYTGFRDLLKLDNELMD